MLIGLTLERDVLNDVAQSARMTMPHKQLTRSIWIALKYMVR